MTKISRPRKCENFVLQYFYRCCRRLHHQVPALVRRQHRAAVGLVAIGPRGLYTVLGPPSSLFAYSATVCTARTPERPQSRAGLTTTFDHIAPYVYQNYAHKLPINPGKY